MPVTKIVPNHTPLVQDLILLTAYDKQLRDLRDHILKSYKGGPLYFRLINRLYYCASNKVFDAFEVDKDLQTAFRKMTVEEQEAYVQYYINKPKIVPTCPITK